MQYVLLLGRIFFSALFILSALGHFSSQTIEAAANQGLPLAAFLIPLTGVLAFLGGLSILVGYKAKIGAWLLVLFIVPTTLLMHRFLRSDDAMMSTMQQVMFLKHLALLGAALVFAYFGSGPMSIDKTKTPSRKKH